MTTAAFTGRQPEPGLDYYLTDAGGKRAFRTTTDYIALPNTSVPESFAMFENPVGSGVVAKLFWGEFGSTSTTPVKFRRMSGATVLTRGTPRPIKNMAGGSTLGKSRLYVKDQFTVDITNAELAKQAVMGPFFYGISLHGVPIWPGGVLYWTMEGRGQEGCIYFELAEVAI